MNNDKQIIAIAKACGWKFDEHKEYIRYQKPGMTYWEDCVYDTRGNSYTIHSFDTLIVRSVIPLYIGDLNEMHKAEETIANDPLKVLEYYRNLVDLIDRAPDGSRVFGKCIYWETLHASAAMRAEAFLRTLNLWTND